MSPPGSRGYRGPLPGGRVAALRAREGHSLEKGRCTGGSGRGFCRAATLSRWVLPPCPFKNTKRLAPARATDAPMSSSRANKVEGLRLTVPGAHTCSVDKP